jgi:hypothetical protein
VSAVGPSLSSARDRAWMPGIRSGGCDRRARRRWLASASETPLGIPTDAILARKLDSGCHRHEERPNHEPLATAWKGFVTTYAVTFGGRR